MKKMMTYVKKNIDTPRGPRPANTPVPGNMIIPSIEAISIYLRITTWKDASETGHLSVVGVKLTRYAIQDVQQAPEQHCRYTLHSCFHHIWNHIHYVWDLVQRTLYCKLAKDVCRATR